MVGFSKNDKWKYSTIGLLAILAVGFSFPQAFAHISNNTADMLNHIYNFVDSLESSVSTLQSTANGIKAKTDTIPSDIASSANVTDATTAINDNTDTRAEEIQDSVGVRKAINIADVLDAEDASIEAVSLIPSTGKVYSGHITAVFDLPSGSLFWLECRVGSGVDFPYRIISTDASGLHTVNEDFSCHSLRLVVEDFENGEDAPGLEYWITAEYVEIDPE